MRFSTDIERSKEGLLFILELLKHYEKDGEVRFIEGIQRRGFNEYKIQELICIVRERTNMTRRELFRLSEIALTYNTLWATDYNNCFRDADTMFRKIRSTLKGTKIIFKKFTPICRKKNPKMDYKPSVYVNSTLSCAACGQDFYGLESYPDIVVTLYAEMGAYFANVMAVLVICHQELTKEAAISQDAALCLKLLNDQCKSIVNDMKDVIGLFSEEKLKDDELVIKSNKLKSLKDFAQQGFHKYNIAGMKRYAASRALANGAEYGLDNKESMYFVNNPEKGKKAMEVMSHFDDYAQKGRGTLMDSTPIVEFICWTGLDFNKGYEYFSSSYVGKYDLPQRKSVYSRLDAFKKADPERAKNGELEQGFVADFERRLNSRIN